MEIAKDKSQLISLIQSQSHQLRQLGADKLGLFGSFVRNEQKDSSDVDLLIEFNPGMKTYCNFIRIIFLLEGLFNRNVELVTPQSLSPGLKEIILKDIQYVTLA
jgi:predicted nucleotidyltransferase